MGADATPAPGAPESGTATKPPLDDIMLAMDVVDTLRQRDRVVRTELEEAGREEELKQRLRKIYADQGLEVSDRVIEQAVAALKEDRFVYKPPPPSLATRLALVYIRRGIWGRWIAWLAGAGALAAALFWLFVTLPNAALPGDFDALHREVAALAATPDARTAVERLYESGQSALHEDRRIDAWGALADLKDLRDVLAQEYTVQIVNRQGEKTGLWRIPDVNTRARNYYIVVEALDPAGRALKLPILNEETGKTKPVKTWALRVSERTYNAVGADKKDDGIVQRNRFGAKARGHLVPEYEMQTTGGAITKW